MRPSPTRFFLLAILVTMLPALPAAAARWQNFTPDSGLFTVTMPAQPSPSKLDKKTGAGTITTHIYTAKVRGSEYTAEYSQLPGIAKVFTSDKGLYLRAKNGFLEHGNLEELNFSNINVDGYAGRELEFKSPDGQTGRARFVLVKKLLYVVVAKGPKGDKTLDRFLSSFKISAP